MNLSLAESKANAIINSLQIRYPSEIDIREISIERGAYVHEKDIAGAEAWLVRKDNRAIITVSSRLREPGRKNFAIAHELGHFELHNDSQILICQNEDMNVWNKIHSQELEANEFASNILMPKEIFKRYIKKEIPNMNRVSELSNEFGTSLTATAIRYAQLSKEPCVVAISSNSKLKWYKRSDSFGFHLRVGDKLSPDCYAYDFFDGKDLPTRPRKVSATAWIAGDIDPDGEIFEHSIALKTYDIVLSLLFVDKEIRYRFRKRDEEEPEYDLTDKFTRNGKRWQW